VEAKADAPSRLDESDEEKDATERALSQTAKYAAGRLNSILSLAFQDAGLDISPELGRKVIPEEQIRRAFEFAANWVKPANVCLLPML
jgi:hypothetical protein